MRSSTPDDLDHRIIQALHVDGRASFSRLSKALGASEQTVARRYRQLRDAEVLRVVGQLDSQRLGQADWIVRLRCAPGASAGLAGALARRPDTAWVQLTSGGTEVFCTVRAHDQSPGTLALLEQLPSSRQVVSVDAYCLLHLFTAGWMGPKGHARLDHEVVAQLRRDRTVLPAGEGARLEQEDWPLVRALAEDGRATFRELAARTHWHESTVRRRIDELMGSGVLYFDLDVAPEALGVGARAFLWMSVEPAQLLAAGEALASRPEVPFAAATTGATNLAAALACEDHRGLFEFLTREIASLAGVTHIESSPIARSVKMHATMSPSIDNGRLDA